MKYHPKTETIVPPFNEHRFKSDELYNLIVADMPQDMKGGDMVLAKKPYRDGSVYRMDYCPLPDGSAGQEVYRRTQSLDLAIAALDGSII